MISFTLIVDEAAAPDLWNLMVENGAVPGGEQAWEQASQPTNPFPSLPFPSLPFPSLPFPSLLAEASCSAALSGAGRPLHPACLRVRNVDK
eukprot:175379-Prorocentrum_minimum.AAC.1